MTQSADKIGSAPGGGRPAGGAGFGGARDTGPRVEDRGSSQPLFLALFLLLLAFFILLNSMSTLEEGRSNEVMESVQQAFPSEIRAAIKDKLLDSDPGQVIGEGLRSRLGAAFRETLPVVEITGDESGNPLYAAVPLRSLVDLARGRVLPAAERLAERLRPILDAPPAGSVLEVQILIGRPDGGRAASDRVIAASRLALTFVEARISDRILGAGLEPGDPETLRFVFRTRPAGRPEPLGGRG